MDERIQIKSRWKSPHVPRIARVMAIGDGWVMYRFKGAMPCLLYWKDFVKKFDPVDAEARG